MIKGYEEYVILAFIFIILLSLMWSVRRGNVTVLYLLNKMGLRAYSTRIDSDFKVANKLNSDCVAWLRVPNTVYAPVMSDVKQYRDRDYLKKESVKGEIGLSLDNINQAFSRFALDGYGIRDMTVIEGKDGVRGNSLRTCQFRLLEKYTKSDLHSVNPITDLYDSTGLRKFKLVGRLEFTLDMKKNFVVQDRKSLIDLLYKQTGTNLTPVYDKRIIFLRTATGLDVSYVILQETS